MSVFAPARLEHVRNSVGTSDTDTVLCLLQQQVGSSVDNVYRCSVPSLVLLQRPMAVIIMITSISTLRCEHKGTNVQPTLHFAGMNVSRILSGTRRSRILDTSIAVLVNQQCITLRRIYCGIIRVVAFSSLAEHSSTRLIKQTSAQKNSHLCHSAPLPLHATNNQEAWKIYMKYKNQ